jgi:hypothetical protein
VRGRPGGVALVALLLSSRPVHADAEIKGPAAPLAALEELEVTYDTRFPTAALYWGAGGALVATGVVTLALSPSPSTSASDRLGVVSGAATIVSGLSSGFSALPLTLAHGELRGRLARARGRPIDDAVARDILAEHAAWARRWRIACQVITPALLAVDGAALGVYASQNSYERATAAVVAGLYGVGVPVVLWYDSLPTVEEQALARAGGGAATTHVSMAPAVLPTARGVTPGLGFAGTF